MKKSTRLTLDKQKGTVFNSLLALHVYHALCNEKQLRVPLGVPVPLVPEPAKLEGLAAKLMSLNSEKKKVELTGDELGLFYTLLDFTARCLVSEQDEEMKAFICQFFDSGNEGFDNIKTHYLAFSSAVIAELNKHR